MSNIYFMCENCGIETNGITFVNGMKFCAKCYQETFGKDNQQNEIQQLKHQLEEKDKDLDFTTKTANELIEIKHKLEKQLEEKDKEIKRVTKIDNKTFLFETYEKPLREQIQQLKQQLIEKQNKIDEISKEFVQAVHTVYDWRVLCAEKDKEIKKLNWQLKDKDFIIKNLNHSLSVAPNANAGQRARIDELTKIVKEKDKEIERLKQQYTILENENGKLTTELIMDKYKKAQKEVSFGKQLAILELEKVRMLTEWKFESIADVVNQIDQQIKLLKGEKEVED